MKRILMVAFAAMALAAEAYDIHAKALTPIHEKAKPAGKALALVKGGRCDFALAYDKKDARATRAAKLLEACFEKTTGTKPAGGAYKIEVVQAADPLEQSLSVETTADGVRLSGNAWFAALDFAERFLGVRWYFPGETGTIYPKIADLTVEPVAYDDSPWFRGFRGDRHYPFMSVCSSELRQYWEPYCGKIDPQAVKTFLDHWKLDGRGCASGAHSPRPEVIAQAHPDKLRTIFYTSPYGKFWYNPGGHVGNYFNVLDFGFADLLIEDWKAFYDSKGKIDRGSYKDTHNEKSCSFGVCDTYMPISEIRADPVVKQLGLVKDSDLARHPNAGMCNIYARFFQYLGNRLKETMPEKKLCLLIYYNSQYASLDPRFTLPDNVELNVCDGRLPGKTRNPKEMEKSVRLFREWYEASGNRPILRAWLYAARFDRFGRAVMPEFVGEVPKVLGKYLSREGGVFYDSDGGSDMWHYFYAVYANCRSQWNPDFDVDAAVAEMMADLCGKEAGAWLTKFHKGVKDAYITYLASQPGESAQSAAVPRALIDELERDLAEAKRCLTPGSVEMRRFSLIADYWPKAFETQRALADYEPPVYEVKRHAPDMDWSKVPDMPMVEFKTGDGQKVASSLKLAWDEKGLYGRFAAPYAPKADATKDLWTNDGLELFFTPGLKKEVVYQFAYDCLGQVFAQKQRLLPIPQAPDASYRGETFAASSKVATDGWTSEFFVPWTLFEEGAPKAYDQWNANFVRNKRAAPVEVISSAFTLGKHANTPMFGILRFLGRGD